MKYTDLIKKSEYLNDIHEELVTIEKVFSNGRRIITKIELSNDSSKSEYIILLGMNPSAKQYEIQDDTNKKLVEALSTSYDNHNNLKGYFLINFSSYIESKGDAVTDTEFTEKDIELVLEVLTNGRKLGMKLCRFYGPYFEQQYPDIVKKIESELNIYLSENKLYQTMYKGKFCHPSRKQSVYIDLAETL